MDMNDLRGISTILCMIGFLAVVFWAYSPSRKERFEEAANLIFSEGEHSAQQEGADKHE